MGFNCLSEIPAVWSKHSDSAADSKYLSYGVNPVDGSIGEKEQKEEKEKEEKEEEEEE